MCTFTQYAAGFAAIASAAALTVQPNEIPNAFRVARPRHLGRTGRRGFRRGERSRA